MQDEFWMMIKAFWRHWSDHQNILCGIQYACILWIRYWIDMTTFSPTSKFLWKVVVAMISCTKEDFNARMWMAEWVRYWQTEVRPANDSHEQFSWLSNVQQLPSHTSTRLTDPSDYDWQYLKTFWFPFIRIYISEINNHLVLDYLKWQSTKWYENYAFSLKKKNCKMYRKILTFIGALILTANCAEVEVNRHFRGDIFSFKGKSFISQISS